MAYDEATGNMVLFGGTRTTHGVLNDTWTWNGSNWTEQWPETSPSPRKGASMTYDAATGNLVLFGGASRTNVEFGDTWIWNGSNWVEQSPGTSCPVRVDASMAYDPAIGRVVLFGGVGNQSGSLILGDTWTWNGSNWTKQATTTSPSARYLSSMAYDQVTGEMVLFGGYSRTEGFLSDTWTWKGTNWIKVSPATHPSVRWEASMAYDTATGSILLFGGNGGFGTYNDSWSWGATASSA